MAEENSKDALVIEKMKNSLLFRLRAQNPSNTINVLHASFIEDRLQHVFKSFHTPTHPPYAIVCSLLYSSSNLSSFFYFFFCEGEKKSTENKNNDISN